MRLPPPAITKVYDAERQGCECDRPNYVGHMRSSFVEGRSPCYLPNLFSEFANFSASFLLDDNDGIHILNSLFHIPTLLVCYYRCMRMDLLQISFPSLIPPAYALRLIKGGSSIAIYVMIGWRTGALTPILRRYLPKPPPAFSFSAFFFFTAINDYCS
jgi:hypothetical protein